MLKQIFKRKISIEILKNESLKGIDDIPGPKGFLGLGNFFNYTKAFGKYSFDELHKAGFDKYQKYGPIVCERMLPGVNIVWLYNPTDIAQMFNDGTGNYPCRRSHQALQKFRKDQPEIYNTGGLLPTNGPEWWKIRSEFQRGLSSPQNVRQYLPYADKITREFLEMLTSNFHSDFIINDMIAEVERLNLELTCHMAFDVRLKSFSGVERDSNSISSKLIKAGDETNKLILPLDQGVQLWRLFDTKEYKKLKKAQEFMQNVALDFIKKHKERENDGNSLLDQYLKNPKIDERDIVGMSCDLLLAGVHTTSYSTGCALYHISNNKRVQKLMYEEAKKVLPNVDDEITPQIMNSEIPYTRAVLKESLRLNPISIGIGRILNHDTVFSGYLVPKNTNVVSLNFVACRLEENFPNALEFKPERWLKSSNQQKVNPYLVIPFGHSMRACIARRFAEQAILIFLLRLMRNYSMEWKGEHDDMEIKTKLINQPDCDIRIGFKKHLK